jgi:uroporphyrinogen-III synthase
MAPGHGLPPAPGSGRPAEVLVTRLPGPAGELVDLLRGEGHDVVLAPLREARLPGPAACAAVAGTVRAGGFDAVTFTSAHGVLGLEAILGEGPAGPLAGAEVRCVGRATARAAREAGLDPAPAPAREDAAGLLAEWPAPEEGGPRSVLCVHGEPHRPELARGLRERGLRVEEAVVYEMAAYPAERPLAPGRREPSGAEVPVLDPAETAGHLAGRGPDVVVATSPRLLEELAERGRIAVPVVCIGATTAARAASLGLRAVTARSPAPRDLLTAVRRVLAEAGRPADPYDTREKG